MGTSLASLTPLFASVLLGFHRNEDMKAIDVLPILKEKVAFLSGQKNIYTYSIFPLFHIPPLFFLNEPDFLFAIF